MTPIQAREELQKRYPNQTVCAAHDSWNYHACSIDEVYKLWVFEQSDIRFYQESHESFEDALAKLTLIQKETTNDPS